MVIQHASEGNQGPISLVLLAASLFPQLLWIFKMVLASYEDIKWCKYCKLFYREFNWSVCFYKAKKQTNIQAFTLDKVNEWSTVHQALQDWTYVFITCKQDIVNLLPSLKFPSRNFMWLVIKCLVWIRQRKKWVLTCSKWGLQNSWFILFLVHHKVAQIYQKRREQSGQKLLGQCCKPPFNSLQKLLVYYTHEEKDICSLAIICVRLYCNCRH